MSIPRKTSPSLGASAVNLAVLSTIVEHVKDDQTEIKTAIAGINDSLKVLGRIEERQLGVVRDFNALANSRDSSDQRITAIETELPGLREMRAWVIKGVSVGVTSLILGIGSLVATAVYDRVVPKQPQPVYLALPPQPVTQNH